MNTDFSKSSVLEFSNERFVVKANTVNFIIYINWIAETIREIKVHHTFATFSWDTWEREGDPKPISVLFDLAPGTIPPPGSGNPMGPFPSANQGEPGYRNVGAYQIAASINVPNQGGGNPSVGTPESLVDSISGMTVNFNLTGTPQSMSITPNLLTKFIAIAVFVVLVVALIAFLGYLFFA